MTGNEPSRELGMVESPPANGHDFGVLFRTLRRRLFGISARETSFERRGFSGGANGVRERLEQIGSTFVAGYHAALETGAVEELEARLQQVTMELRGFAFEGAAMGLALLDWLTPWKRDRIAHFLAGAGDAHAYMVHVGIGWAWARLPVNLERAITRFDPLLRWLVVDGYGFHEGFFRWPRYLNGQAPQRQITGYGLRAFDQGLGRCLWFIKGGEVERIVQAIADFPKARQGDLWSGVGLASTYAGFASEAMLQHLRQRAGLYQAELAQGAAFAAKARSRAGNATEYTGRAVHNLCGMTTVAAAQLTDQMLSNLPTDTSEAAFEVWRQRLSQCFRDCPQESVLKPGSVL